MSKILAVRPAYIFSAAVAGLALAAAAEAKTYSCSGERNAVPVNQMNCASCTETDDVEFTLELDLGDAKTSVSVTIDEIRLVCDPVLVPKGQMVCADHFLGLNFEMNLDSLEFKSKSVDVYSYTASSITGVCKLP